MTSMRMSAKSKFMAGFPSIGSRRGLRDSCDFLDRGDAEAHLLEAVVAQQLHAVRDGHVADAVGRRAVDRELADLVVDGHDLVEADAALVAGVTAARAAG